MKGNEWAKRNLPLLLVGLISVALVIAIQRFQLPIEQRQVKVGCLLIGSKKDGGWNEGHYSGLLKACTVHDCSLTVKEHVEEMDENVVSDAVRELVDEGANVIFLTSFGYGLQLDKIAQQYPRVAFFSISSCNSSILKMPDI